MKLGSRYSKSEQQSSLFLLIFLLNLKYGYLRSLGIECDWSVQRLSCPPYTTTDWHCLRTQLNCTNGEEYHCLRDESGEWTETCAKPMTCSKGQEPVLRNFRIVCTNCKNPERYEPIEGTESHKYSECRRIKTSCPRDVSHECPVDETVRYAQNRRCRCAHEKDYMPQNYDLSSDTRTCKKPEDLNCIHAPCPEDVYGNQQTRTKDYKCARLLSPVTPTPSKKSTIRTSIPVIHQTSTKSSRETGQIEETENPPVWILMVGILTGILALVFVVFVVAGFHLRKRGHLELPDPPSEPFEATTINYTSINLSWRPPKNETSCLLTDYVLAMKEDEKQNWEIVETIPHETTEFEVKKLEAGTAYLFRVAAKNKKKIGEFLVMTEKVYTKPFTRPSTPRNINGYFDKEKRYIRVEWEPPFDDGGLAINAFRVDYYNTSKHKWEEGEIVNKNDLTCNIGCLVGGCNYKFRVQVMNERGWSDPCELEQTLTYLSVPSKPTEIGISKTESEMVTLTWKAPKKDGGTTIKKYNIRVRHDGDEAVIPYEPKKYGLKSFHKEVTELIPESKYYFGVCAENEIGPGEYIDTEEPTVVPKKISVPGIPGAVKKPEPGYTDVKLSWCHPKYDGGSPVINYIVVQKQKYLQDKRIGQTSAEKTEFHVKGLTEGKNYTFCIHAQNKKGNSLPLEMEVDTKPATKPGKPPGSIQFTDVRSNQITMSWAASADDGGSPITGYCIEYFDGMKNEWTVAAKSIQANSLIETNLQESRLYVFHVSAINAKGNSEPLESEVRTLPKLDSGKEKDTKASGKEPTQFYKNDGTPIDRGLPGQPTHLNIALKESKLIVSWEAPEYVGGSKLETFQVQMKENENTWNLCAVVKDTSRDLLSFKSKKPSCSVEQIAAGVRYSFRVRARNKNGEGDFAETTTPVVLENVKGKFRILNEVGPNRTSTTTATGVHSSSQEAECDQEAGQRQNSSGNQTESTENRKPIHDKDETPSAFQPVNNAMSVQNIPSIPVGPLMATNIGATEITLSWQPPEFSGTAPVEEYFLHWKSGVSDWDLFGRMSAEEPICHITGLQEKTSYRFRVKAANQWGHSDPLEMVEDVKTKTLQAPLPPTGPIEFTEFTDCSVRLTWKPPMIEASALTGYIIEYMDIQKTFTPWNSAGTVTADKTTWVQQNLEQGLEYKFRVICNNAKGTSKPLESQQLIRPIISKYKNEDAADGRSMDKDEEVDEGDCLAGGVDETNEQKALCYLEGTRDKDWHELLDESVIKPFLEESLKFPREIPSNISESATINIYKDGSKSLPCGLIAYESPDNGNSLFNSVSMILFGNTNFSNRLRLAAALDGIAGLNLYIKQYFGNKSKKDVMNLMKLFLTKASAEELASFYSDKSAELYVQAMRMAVKETAIPESKCNPLQVQFLSTATGFRIKQHFEQGAETFYGKVNQKSEIVEPAKSRKVDKSTKDESGIHILWVSDKNLRTAQGKTINRVYPVMEIKNGIQETTF